MSFGSPNKVLTPSNVSSPHVSKLQTPHSHPMYMQNPIQLKPGTVSMYTMINNAALKIYTDFQRLTDIIRSVGDCERKKEIIKFLSCSRSLLIRIQALNKWTTSAMKVDKCEKISNLLDEQSSFLVQTAEELSILARDRLPHSRLPNIMPIIAADIFATKTYSRLPNHIRWTVLRKQPISRNEKKRVFDELDRILRIRLSNSKIPYRMRNIKIRNGRVTFTVSHEFVVTLTLMSDHFDHPWRVLDIYFLVQGNNICRGRSLIHKNHLRDVHRRVQNRMNISHQESYPSLFHLYDMLHFCSLSIQLEVLNEQLDEYMKFNSGIEMCKPTYVQGMKLSFVYWPIGEKYTSRPSHSLTITIDEDDTRKPLKLKHQPPINSDRCYVDKILDYSNLSIKNIISQTIGARIFSTLKIVQRLLFPFVIDSNEITENNPVLYIPILKESCIDYQLKIQIKSSNGDIDCQFNVTTDFLSIGNKSRVSEIIASLSIEIRELLLKSYSNDNKKMGIVENRELMSHRRKISELFTKLRIIMSTYKCYHVLQKAGYKDLQLFFHVPPFSLVKCEISEELKLFYEVKEMEAKGDCELIYIPLNNKYNYLVISCEIRYRSIPSYRIFELVIVKTFSKNKMSNYNDRCWSVKPMKFKQLTVDVVKKMINTKFQESSKTNSENSLKRRALTCSDLMNKRRKLMDNMLCDDGKYESGKSSQDMYDNSYLMIENLPSIIGYMEDNIIIKQLFNEMERRGVMIRYEKIMDDIYVTTCKVMRFPKLPGYLDRTWTLMNKLLYSCSITYFVQPPESDGTSIIRWQANFIMKSPLILMHKNTYKPPVNKNSNSSMLITKQIVLSNKRCVEENSKGIVHSVDCLLNIWKQMARFCQYCFLPLLENSSQFESNIFKIMEYDFSKLELGYGDNHMYRAHIYLSPNDTFKIDFETNLQSVPASYKPEQTMNPHIIIQRDIERDFNKEKCIGSVIKILSDTLAFLQYMMPFYDPSPQLMVIQEFCDQQPSQALSIVNPNAITTGGNISVDTMGVSANSVVIGNTTSNITNTVSSNPPSQLFRQYTLLIMNCYHLVLVFREKFALNIHFNSDTKTVSLSDSYDNFHACNMSIYQMPKFDKFISSLEDTMKLDIEADVWSGPCLSQLNRLLGVSITNKELEPHHSIGYLQYYLSSASQLVSTATGSSKDEISIILPHGSENDCISTNLTNNTTNQPEIRISLDCNRMDSHNSITPIWRLAIISCKFESGSGISWISEHDLGDTVKSVFNSKVANRNKVNRTGNALLIFKRLLQLPSLKLQKNLLNLLNNNQNNSIVDLDWFNPIYPSISHQQQDPSSIVLRLIVIVPPNLSSTSTEAILPIIMHYAAKSNQITILTGTHPSIQALGLDKEANEFVVMDANDTPLPSFVEKLKQHLNNLF